MSREVLQMALDALVHAEAGLADIGDADREPGDDLAWCEDRAAQALAKPREAIEALRAELAKPDGWQSIESAPKDGIILLGLPVIGRIKAEDRRVYEGRWHEDQSTWTSVNGFIILGCASHWMPLPHPPTP